MANEVSVNLNKFINELEPKYLHKAMTDACALVRNDAVKRAPQRTGALRRSIDFKVENDGTEGVIFSNVEYAPYVECGTGQYAKQGNGRKTPWVYKSQDGFFTTSGQRPQPFLEPALQTNTTKIRDCFTNLI